MNQDLSPRASAPPARTTRRLNMSVRIPRLPDHPSSNTGQRRLQSDVLLALVFRPTEHQITLDVRVAIDKLQERTDIRGMLSLLLRGTCNGSPDIAATSTCRPELQVTLMPSGARRTEKCFSSGKAPKTSLEIRRGFVLARTPQRVEPYMGRSGKGRLCPSRWMVDCHAAGKESSCINEAFVLKDIGLSDLIVDSPDTVLSFRLSWSKPEVSSILRGWYSVWRDGCDLDIGTM